MKKNNSMQPTEIIEKYYDAMSLTNWLKHSLFAITMGVLIVVSILVYVVIRLMQHYDKSEDAKQKQSNIVLLNMLAIVFFLMFAGATFVAFDAEKRNLPTVKEWEQNILIPYVDSLERKEYVLRQIRFEDTAYHTQNKLDTAYGNTAQPVSGAFETDKGIVYFDFDAQVFFDLDADAIPKIYATFSVEKLKKTGYFPHDYVLLEVHLPNNYIVK